jgi:mRNA interferase RelE/StbE
MPNYQLRWSKLAGKELDRIPPHLAERIYNRTGNLALIPRPPGALKLKGHSSWRIRMGDYRVLYPIDDNEKTISIMSIRHRKDVYRYL